MGVVVCVEVPNLSCQQNYKKKNLRKLLPINFYILFLSFFLSFFPNLRQFFAYLSLSHKF